MQLVDNQHYLMLMGFLRFRFLYMGRSVHCKRNLKCKIFGGCGVGSEKSLLSIADGRDSLCVVVESKWRLDSTSLVVSPFQLVLALGHLDDESIK